MTMIDTPEGIEAFRLLSCRGRMQLELRGLKFRVATFPAMKRQFPDIACRSNQLFLINFETMLRERGILS